MIKAEIGNKLLRNVVGIIHMNINWKKYRENHAQQYVYQGLNAAAASNGWLAPIKNRNKKYIIKKHS